MHTAELLPNLPELTPDEAERWLGAAVAEQRRCASTTRDFTR